MTRNSAKSLPECDGPRLQPCENPNAIVDFKELIVTVICGHCACIQGLDTNHDVRAEGCMTVTLSYGTLLSKEI